MAVCAGDSAPAQGAGGGWVSAAPLSLALQPQLFLSRKVSTTPGLSALLSAAPAPEFHLLCM